MTKYNSWSLIGLIMSTLAGIFFWLYLLSEMLTNVTGAPLIFIGLLILITVVIGAAWLSPGVAPLLLLFAGVMLSTYSATTSGRYDLLASLTLGLPFLLGALLIMIGNKILAERSNFASPPDHKDLS